ncbi:MAG: hypothetical protein ACHQNT_01690 [Bacteroidia bacterium]
MAIEIIKMVLEGASYKKNLKKQEKKRVGLQNIRKAQSFPEN